LKSDKEQKNPICQIYVCFLSQNENPNNLSIYQDGYIISGIKFYEYDNQGKLLKKISKGAIRKNKILQNEF